MKHLPIILTLALLLASCATLRKETTSNTTSATDTTHVTVVDTTHVTIIHQRDSTTTAQTHQRDSIIIRETITSTYDPATGLIVGQVIDRLTSQISDITAYQQTIQAQQHIIDSLAATNATLAAAQTSAATSSSDIKERGDAARTGWQSFLHTFSLSWAIVLTIIFLIVACKHYWPSTKK